MQLQSPLRNEGKIVVSEGVVAVITALSIVMALGSAWSSIRAGATVSGVVISMALTAVVTYVVAVHAYVLLFSFCRSPFPKLLAACCLGAAGVYLLSCMFF